MKRYYSENEVLSDSISNELAAFYRHHLLQEILPHWKELSLDETYGGYETNFDENWAISGDTKNVWAQSRNLIMFSLIYQYAEQDARWMELISSGRNFLVNHFYAGNGLWNYRVSNDGLIVLEGPISLLGDMFAMEALSRYVIVSGDQQDIPLIQATYQTVKTHLLNPDYQNIMPHIWQPGLERHSHYMLMVNALESVEQVLGRETVHHFLMECIDKILYFFCGTGRDSYLFEYRNLDASIVHGDSGHLINPGHIFESMWFCLRVCLAENDERRIRRILEITDRTFDMAIDRKYGGFFHLLDCTGKAAFVQADIRNRQLNWNDKVDWVNAEALYLLALIAVTTKESDDFKKFILHHNYCQKYFYDRVNGDWTATLSQCGTPLSNIKGMKHRCAFHVPRSVLDTYLVFETFSKLSNEE